MLLHALFAPRRVSSSHWHRLEKGWEAAAFHGNVARLMSVVERLLQHHTNINAVDREGHTSLMLAAREGRADLVRFLLAHGADGEATDVNGHTALCHAAKQGCVSVVLALLRGKAVTTVDCALLSAAGCGHQPVVSILLQRGGLQTSFPLLINALMLAIKGSHIDTAKELLATIPATQVPLVVAAKRGLADAVAVLLGLGASPDATDANGRTALSVAAAHRDERMMCA